MSSQRAYPCSAVPVSGSDASAQSYRRGPFAPSPQLRRFHADSGALAASASARADPPLGGDALIAGHGEDVADAAALQPGPELHVLAVGLVRGYPPGR